MNRPDPANTAKGQVERVQEEERKESTKKGVDETERSLSGDEEKDFRESRNR